MLSMKQKEDTLNSILLLQVLETVSSMEAIFMIRKILLHVHSKNRIALSLQTFDNAHLSFSLDFFVIPTY